MQSALKETNRMLRYKSRAKGGRRVPVQVSDQGRAHQNKAYLTQKSVMERAKTSQAEKTMCSKAQQRWDAAKAVLRGK